MQRSYDILLIEDNPADVEITLEAFRRSRSSNRVYVCRDGEDALDFIFQRGRYTRGLNAPRPDMILLDLNLPRRSGFEVLEQIKRHELLCEIPVIILTTSDRDEDLRRAFHLGTNSYVTKPVQFDDCVKLVAGIQHYWLELSKLPPR